MTDPDDQNCDPVLLSSFVIRKKRCRVVFHRGTLTWETEGAAYTRCSLSLINALGVNYVHSADISLCCDQTQAEDGQLESEKSPTAINYRGHNSFTIHYVERVLHNKLRHQSVTFNHTDHRQVASWVKTLRNYIAGIKQRPKRLLVFVNPFGGKKKGLSIYEQQVKPLFAIAGIECTVILTEGANHVCNFLLDCSLDMIDGIACVGGDGTFNEVFNGLLLRTAKDHNVDPNDPDVELPSPSLRVGVIPGGSTDTMAYCFHGTIQVHTAILHIILGDSTGLDICSVHNNTKLLRFYSSVISYGFLGDVCRDSEKLRWMGPKRYDYTGFKKFLSNKGYAGEVTVSLDSSDASVGPKCYEKCERCLTEKDSKNKSKDLTNPQGVASLSSSLEQKTFRGKFFMVSCANVSCACKQSPNGLSPNCHLGDGCIDVLLVKHTGWLNTLKLFLTLASRQKSVYELPFVEIHRAREFTFRSISESESNNTPPNSSSLHASTTSVWNCDGEVQPEVNIKTRVHCQVLQVFTRRMPAEQEEELPCCNMCRGSR